MKVSGAVAMADDPEHAFGIDLSYKEVGVVAGAAGCEARTEKSVSARSPLAAPHKHADFDVYLGGARCSAEGTGLCERLVVKCRDCPTLNAS